MNTSHCAGILKTAVRSSLVVAVIGSVSPGAAQTPADEPQRDTRRNVIEEVTVTARRVEESLQDTPVSVAAFSPDDLTNIGASQAGDIAKYTPNLEMRKQPGSEDNYSLSIRGVAAAESALAIDPTVGIYVDGVYIARMTGLAFDIVDMERIEVLRGPQGTLFGRNTIGGAINVVTQKPRGEFAFKQQLSGGDEGYHRVHTTVDLPAIAGLAAKLSYLNNSRDGEMFSSITGDDVGASAAEAYRIALTWSPVDSLNADYIYDRLRSDNNGNGHQVSHVRPIYADPNGQFYGGQYHETAAALSSDERLSQFPITNSDPEESNSDIDGHALTVEWQATDSLTVKSISSLREWDSAARGSDFGAFPSPDDGSLCKSTDPTDYNFVTGTCLDPVPAGTPVPIFGASRESSQEQWTQELQFIGRAFDDRLAYTAGLFYFEEQAREVNPQSLVLPAAFAFSGLSPALIPANRGNSVVIQLPFFRYATDNSSYAAYGEFTYTPITDLDITLGVRYTVDKKETTLTNTLDATTTNPAGTVKTVTDDDEWNNFNPQLTVNYRWSPALSTYAKAATGYRSGGYNVRVRTSDAFRTPFDEEEVTSYELGFKSDLFDRRLRFNGAVFHMIYSEQQVAAFEAGSGGASTNIVNAGKSTNSGVELEMIWLPVTGMRVTASYGYLKVDFKEFETGVVDPVTGQPTGENRDISDTASTDRYAPDHSGSLAVEYQFTPWRWGQLTLRADATYTDRITFHPQLNLFDASDAHTLVNARATLGNIDVGDGSLSFAAWGRNLTDEEYRDFGIDFGVVGFAMNTYGHLRSWGVDAVYRFGR